MKKIRNVECWQFILGTMLFVLLLGADVMVDPTRPPDIFYVPSNTAASTSTDSFQLTAIFVYRKHNMAVIGGQNIVEGDHIGEYTVTTITANTVELTGSDNTRQLLTLVKSVKQEQ